MDFKSENYIKLIEITRNRDKEQRIVHQILSGISDKKHDIVLDVGCGGGNLTSLLDSEITVGHIYGLDISEYMIAFAKQNHMKDNISYIVQDFGVEFDSLVPALKALEGKVSLIFSYSVFNLIPNVKNLSDNLYRMLTKGGEVYAYIRHTTDHYMDLTVEEKAIHEREFMKIPDSRTQINVFLNEFKSVDFDVICDECLETKDFLNINDFKQYLVPTLVSTYRKYFVTSDEDMIQLKYNELEQKITASYRHSTDANTGEEMVECLGKHSFVILKKR